MPIEKDKNSEFTFYISKQSHYFGFKMKFFVGVKKAPTDDTIFAFPT